MHSVMRKVYSGQWKGLQSSIDKEAREENVYIFETEVAGTSNSKCRQPNLEMLLPFKLHAKIR